MHIPWEDLEIFLTVAEEKSFSAAARRMGLTQPTISRRIGALEQRLERALFRRDVEGAHLTEEGATLHPAALEMARFARELGTVAESFDDRPAGVVRCVAPPGTALELLVPFARDLKDTLPDIDLHVISAVDYLDLSRGQAELALRATRPTQPDLEVLVHARIPMGVFTSKSYAKRLSKRGFALTPRELDWIAWAYPNEHVEPNPTLGKIIPQFRPAFASNDYNVQCRAVSEGLGAMILPRTRHPDQPYGAFVELDIGLKLPPTDVYLVCAKTMRWVPRVRAVVTQLVERLKSIEGLELLEE